MIRFNAGQDYLWVWLDEGMRPSDIFFNDVLDGDEVDFILAKLYAQRSPRPPTLWDHVCEIDREYWRAVAIGLRGERLAKQLNEAFGLGPFVPVPNQSFPSRD